jgi:hypothetical protein
LRLNLKVGEKKQHKILKNEAILRLVEKGKGSHHIFNIFGWALSCVGEGPISRRNTIFRNGFPSG